MFKIRIDCNSISDSNIKIVPPTEKTRFTVMSSAPRDEDCEQLPDIQLKPGAKLSSNLQAMMQRYSKSEMVEENDGEVRYEATCRSTDASYESSYTSASTFSDYDRSDSVFDSAGMSES